MKVSGVNTIKKIILIVIIITLLTGCHDWQLSGQVKGEVIGKEYKEAYITTYVVLIGKVLVPKINRYPAKYIVVVKYGELSISINDKNLYESVEKGDIVPVNLYINEVGEEIIRYEQ